MPQPTPYDLCFRLFGFPVRVHPLFWVITLLLGPTQLNVPHAAARIGLWLACVFASILLHELGHALAYRYFRCFGAEIWLYWFGGLASANHRPAGHWPNIIISLAGPAAQLILCGLVWLSDRSMPWEESGGIYTEYLYFYLIVINLYWPIFNLLPVWPLDGGQAMREICYLSKMREPEQTAMKISMIAAGAVAILGLLGEFAPHMLSGLPLWFPVPGLFSVLFFGSLAYSAYENLQALQHGPRYYREDNW